MTAVWIVSLSVLLFAGSHLVLGYPPVRPWLARRLGEHRFVALFSGVAGLCLLLSAGAVYHWGDQGPRMPQPGPLLRATLMVLATAGWLLAMAAIDTYGRSPMALFRTRFAPPAGIQIITRHGFFVGLCLFAVAHAGLVPTLAQAIHFVGFATLAAVGAIWQDHKLLRRHGPAYADFMASTSILPFAAVLRGRQRLSIPSWRVCWRPLAYTLAVLAAHPWLSQSHGAWFAALLGIGGLTLSLRRLLASRAQT